MLPKLVTLPLHRNVHMEPAPSRKRIQLEGISYQACIAATITINITRLGWTRYSYSVAIWSSHPIIELQNSLSTRQSIETS